MTEFASTTLLWLPSRKTKIWAELRKRDDHDKLVENAKAISTQPKQLYSDGTRILDNLNDDNAEELAALYSSFREYQTMRYTDMTQRFEANRAAGTVYRRINSYLVN